MKKLIFLFAIALLSTNISAQIVYSNPSLPTADEFVTLYFNAEGTGLENYTGDVYTHTGLTIDGNQWQNVIGRWGVNATQPQLTRLDDNLYKLDLEPTVREFYDADATDNITELCIVFRSEDANQQTSPDIFYPIYELGLNINLVYPDITPFFVDAGEEINVLAEATLANEIQLYVDKEWVATAQGNNLSENIIASMDQDTKHWIKVVASDGVEEVADSSYYYVRGETIIEDLPDGVREGINYLSETSVCLVLFAPYKSSVYVKGDFSDWEIGEEFKMKRTHEDTQYQENRYWIILEDLNPGEEYAYQYLIDEELVVADAFCDKVLDPWNDPWILSQTYPNLKEYPEKATGIVSVFQTAQSTFDWQIENFDAPEQDNLVVYECLIRDFLSDHSYESLKDSISYFKDLGITALELMPVMEFEGNESWGYNAAFHMAADKYYGPREKLKELIDEAHQNGIAIIVDIVMNHAYHSCPLVQMYFDPNAGNWGQPSPENPWFNETSPNPDYSWGADFDHESQATKDYLDRVNEYWLTEFKVDGFRFDFTKGFTNTPGNGWGYDAARINILKRMADEIWDINPQAYVILEHFCDNSEERVLANYGMMVWGNHNYNYNEATMGWIPNSNFSGVSYDERNFNDPHLVGYMESHDEERLMYKNLEYGNFDEDYYDVRDTTTAIKRIELAANFFIPIPGPKMIWQFGELGYDYSINYCPDGTISEDCRVANKPVRWDYYNDYRRKHLHDVYKALNGLKKDYPTFQTTSFDLNVGGSAKRIRLNHTEMDVVILGNFDVDTLDINPQFQQTGWWYEFYTGDSLNVTNVSEEISLLPGEYRLYTDVRLPEPEISAISLHPTASGFDFQLFPNPANDKINIELSGMDNENIRIDIYNISQVHVLSLDRTIRQYGSERLSIDVGNLHQGVYFVRVSDGINSHTKKLMIFN